MFFLGIGRLDVVVVSVVRVEIGDFNGGECGIFNCKFNIVLYFIGLLYIFAHVAGI